MNSNQRPQEGAGPDDRGHDRLAWRLADILLRFNRGERLFIDELAAEYGVHHRTVLRDLTERFAFLPIERAGNCYNLDPAYLGRLSFHDIKRFAALTGLHGLFPALDAQFFRELFDSRLRDAFSIHGPSYEDLRSRLDDFRALQRAVTERRRLRFSYAKDDGTKLVEADHYRLINNNGVWYLAAIHDGKPKSYAFGKLATPELLEARFAPDAAISRMLDEEDSIWLNVKKTEVILAVAAPAAPYFRRRKLIAQQVIDKELEDGGLIASGKFAHPNQILPIVRYWLPSVRIISPITWRKEMEHGLRKYLTAS
jgi:predicted DNA-binding transcriptional regulator YafY